MALDGALGDAEPRADLTVAQRGGHQAENLAFPGRQPSGRPGLGRLARVEGAVGDRDRHHAATEVGTGPERGGERLAVGALVQIAAGTLGEEVLDQPRVVVHGQHDDAQVRLVLEQLADGGGRILVARHLDVEEDGVGPVPGGQPHYLLAVTRLRADLEVALGAQQIAQSLA